MTEQEAAAISTRLDGHVARVTLDRRESRNSLDLSAMHALSDVLADLSADPSVGAILLAGAGGMFCSGADLGAMSSSPHGMREIMNAQIMQAVSALITRVAESPVPVIAVVEGAAAGVGASLAFACDLVVASPQAFFVLPFTAIGLIPDGGSTATVAASIGRARAMRMALLGERLSAEDARLSGLVTEVASDPHEVAASWAAKLAAGSADAIAATKAAVNAASIPSLASTLARESDQQLVLLHADDFRDGLAAFFARRAPAFARSVTSNTSSTESGTP